MSATTPSFRCCVDNCISIINNQQHRFFNFPRNKTRCEAWLENIPKIFIDRDHPVSTKDLKICAKHFAEDMFSNPMKNVLLSNAVPIFFNNLDETNFTKADYKIDIEDYGYFGKEVVLKEEKDPLFDNVLKDLCRQVILNVAETEPGLQEDEQLALLHEIKGETINTQMHPENVTNNNNNTAQFKLKDFYKICRICFTTDDTILTDIFISKYKETTFMSILDKNNNSELYKNISRFICINCAEDMLQYHNFEKKIEISTSLLNDLYKNFTESNVLNIICLPKMPASVPTLDDCYCLPYSKSVRQEPLQTIIRRCNFENDDSTDLQVDDQMCAEEIGMLNGIKNDIMHNDVKLLNDSPERVKFIQSRHPISEDKSFTTARVRKRNPIWKRTFTADEELQRRTCPICNEVCSSRNAMSVHKHLQHSNKPRKYARPPEPPTYTAEEQLQRRTCPLCNKVCKNRLAMYGHKTVAHVLAQCDICQAKMKKASIRAHMRRVHKMVNGKEVEYPDEWNKVLCTECGKRVAKSQYKDHLRTHLVVKSLVCDLCDFRTKSRHNLHKHQRLHGERKYLCAACGKGYHKKNYLDVHIATHTTLDEPIVCQDCLEQFQTKFDYDLHCRVKHEHEEESTSTGPHTCPICHKEFNTYMTFYNHKQTHNARRLMCKICEKPYKTNITLAVHMRTHNGDKPYKCLVCDKSFAQEAYLRVHMTCVHRNERAFNCLVCNKGFNLKNNLREHLRIHSGDRLVCEHCDKAFINRSNFSKHMRQVHGKDPAASTT